MTLSPSGHPKTSIKTLKMCMPIKHVNSSREKAEAPEILVLNNLTYNSFKKNQFNQGDEQSAHWKL